MMVALAVIGASSASADEVQANVGDEVEVKDGDTIVVKLPKSQTHVRLGGKTKVVTPTSALDDEFAQQAKAVTEPEDATSSVEFAMFASKDPNMAVVGSKLGFATKVGTPLVRAYAGATFGKALTDLSGSNQNLWVFGFNAGVSKLMTKTVELGIFGTATWSYRDVVREASASFIGAGPALRVNKWGVFVEAGIPIGYCNKFSRGWETGSALQAAFGFRF